MGSYASCPIEKDFSPKHIVHEVMKMEVQNLEKRASYRASSYFGNLELGSA